MRKLVTRHFDFINALLGLRYKVLLISLVCMIIVPSFFDNSSYQVVVTFLLRLATVFLAIYAVQENKFQLYTGIVVASIVLVVNQMGILKSEATIDFYFSFVIYLLFYSFVAYKLLRMIIVSPNVRIGVLYACVIVYLLIGVIGGYLFMLIENASPGSINNLEIVNMANPSKFFYFSFITLSTLGYGDITPNSPIARSIVMILSTAGPLYLTVLVALLVSRFEHSDIH